MNMLIIHWKPTEYMYFDCIYPWQLSNSARTLAGEIPCASSAARKECPLSKISLTSFYGITTLFSQPIAIVEVQTHVNMPYGRVASFLFLKQGEHICTCVCQGGRVFLKLCFFWCCQQEGIFRLVKMPLKVPSCSGGISASKIEKKL